MSTGARTCSGGVGLGLRLQVLLCDRGQHGDEQTESSKDVQGRKGLRSGAGRVEVSVAQRS